VGPVSGEHGRSSGTMVSVGERPVSASGPDPRAHQPAELDAQSPRTSAGPNRRYLLGLAAVILIAFVARFWGLLYGLPHSYYPDESSVVGDALKMATTGDPRPSQFLWPTFWIYVVAISLRVGLLASWLPGGIWPLGTAALDNMTYVYGVSRTVTALAGVLTVLGLYAVGARWLERLGLPTPRLYALLGAGFLALSPLHIQHSHVTSPDVPTTAFVVLAAWLVLRLLDSGTPIWYLLGGVAIGLASAAKYPSAMFAAALVVAHLARAGLSLRRPWTPLLALFDLRLWAAGLVTVAVFFATSPYILLDWQHFQADFVSQANRVLQRGPVGEVGVTGPFAPILYVPLAMAWGLDTPVALLALVGLAAAGWLAFRRGPGADTTRWALLTLLVFPILLYVFSWSWQHRFARYLVPLVPFGCLLAALGLAGLVGLLSRARPTLPASLIAVALGVGAMLYQADGVIRYDLLLTRPDTRTLTARWLEQNLPPGEQVMVEWYGPPYGNVRQMGFDLSDRPLDRYLGRTPRYVVTSSFSYDRWLRDPAQFGRRVAFYTTLHQQTPLLFEIRPWPELAYDPVQEGWDGWHGLPLDASARPGPVLRVHQLTP
jgi:4-amino-4-deoxy-L-arabinose transferase-like glycosyltransferase